MGGPAGLDMSEYAAAAPQEKEEKQEEQKDDVSVGNIEEIVKTLLSNNPALSGFKVEVKGHEVDENGHVLVNCVVSPPPQATEIDVVIGPDGETKEEA